MCSSVHGRVLRQLAGITPSLEQKWKYTQPTFPHVIPHVPYVFMLRLMLLVPLSRCNLDKRANIISAALQTSVSLAYV